MGFFGDLVEGIFGVKIATTTITQIQEADNELKTIQAESLKVWGQHNRKREEIQTQLKMYDDLGRGSFVFPVLAMIWLFRRPTSKPAMLFGFGGSGVALGTGFLRNQTYPHLESTTKKCQEWSQLIHRASILKTEIDAGQLKPEDQARRIQIIKDKKKELDIKAPAEETVGAEGDLIKPALAHWLSYEGKTTTKERLEDRSSIVRNRLQREAPTASDLRKD
eukprot:TRINITY_DN9567_c0_g1_i3.p1 TRINITY_DN9567_c0_g1~~TRINITY_DN9567_c0_g1_i3.p1  ORF type:complete len:221 (-),score=63.17 TRINITY_DN9567_c0_g1_i3:36-698(-)